MTVLDSGEKKRLLPFIVLLIIFLSCGRDPDYRFWEYKNGLTLPDINLSADNLSFIAIGDFGRGDAGQIAVADQMGIYHTADNQDFIVLLGDNFYSSGVSSTSDPLFDQYFRDIYDNAILDIPFYVVLGNHDHYGNAAAQIEYQDPDGRWTFPSLFYNFSCILNDGTEIDFFMIDTYVIAEHYSVAEYQLQWLEDRLSSSSADFRIAVSHYPIYSSGLHGYNPFLEDKLGTLFTKYDVNLYISGHDHHMEIFFEKNGFIQVISGAASDGLRSVSPGDDTEWAESILGFAAFKFQASGFTVSFIQSDGTVLFTQTY